MYIAMSYDLQPAPFEVREVKRMANVPHASTFASSPLPSRHLCHQTGSFANGADCDASGSYGDAETALWRWDLATGHSLITCSFIQMETTFKQLLPRQ